MSGMYRNTRQHVATLIRIAHHLLDMDDGHGDELLTVAHEIGGRSLVGNFPEPNLLASLRNLCQDQGIQWAIIGGLALAVHGQLRNTDDIDILVDRLPRPHEAADARYMERFGFYRAKSSTGTVMTIDHRQDGYCELLVAETPLMKHALKTAKNQTMLRCQVPVVEPDTLVALKIHAMVSTPSRRAKDMPDIVSVLEKSHPDLTEIRGLLSPDENAALDKLI